MDSKKFEKLMIIAFVILILASAVCIVKNIQKQETLVEIKVIRLYDENENQWLVETNDGQRSLVDRFLGEPGERCYIPAKHLNGFVFTEKTLQKKPTYIDLSPLKIPGG